MTSRKPAATTAVAWSAVLLVACSAGEAGDHKRVDRAGSDVQLSQSGPLSLFDQIPPARTVPSNAGACQLTSWEEVGAMVGDTVTGSFWAGSNRGPGTCSFYFGEGGASKTHLVSLGHRVAGSDYTDAEYKHSALEIYNITNAREIDNLGTVAFCAEVPAGDLSNPANIHPVPVTWIRIYTDRGNKGKYGFSSFEFDAYSSSCDQLIPFARVVFSRIPSSGDFWE